MLAGVAAGVVDAAVTTDPDCSAGHLLPGEVGATSDLPWHVAPAT
ncbi:hypothetical protein [Streptomyces aquilus]